MDNPGLWSVTRERIGRLLSAAAGVDFALRTCPYIGMAKRRGSSTAGDSERIIQSALREVARRCPRLVSSCYWAGTSAIAVEELHHRKSLDLDLHTCKALVDVRPLLAEMHASFRERLGILQAPDEFGSGFRGLLKLARGEEITVEVLSNFESVSTGDLVPSRTVPGLKRVTIERYLADKIQCVVERSEARDLVDIAAVLERFPNLESKARKFLADQDAVMVTERLSGWGDRQIEDDLASYDDVNPRDARMIRERLLTWLKPERP